MVLKAWEMAAVYVEGAILFGVAAVFALSRFKAWRIGIIKVKFPIYPARFALTLLCSAALAALAVLSLISYRRYSDHIADMQTRGIIAVADHENTTVDELLSGASFIGEESYEEIYVERETARFQSLSEDALRNAAVFGANALVVALIIAMSGGAYFTKKGVMFFSSFRILRTTARIRYGKILFFVNGDLGQVFATFPVTSTNRKIFNNFIISAENILAED